MVGIGIIGAGIMGQAHAESVSLLPNTKLVAVMDTDLLAVQAVINKYGGEAVTSVDELAARTDIQIIIIATPTPFHYGHAKAALERGKHVFVEMPFVRHIHEGEELIQLAKQKNLIITVNHLMRRYKEYELIKQKVESGAVGKPGMIRLSRQTPHPKKWYSNFESSGGVALDAMCHEFDFLNWCFGGIQRIYCQGLHGRHDTGSMDYALASMRMQSGAVAHIESSWCHKGQYNLAVEVAGNEGLIHYKNQDAIPMELSLLSPETDGRSYFTESPVIYPAHYLVLKECFAAVNGNGENPVSGEDGLTAVRCALAAVDSIHSKKPVTLS